MQLSAEVFEWVVGLVRSDTAGQPEKRRNPRGVLHALVMAFPIDGGDVHEPCLLHVQDLSSTGMRITHDQPLAPGARFVLQLPRMGAAPLRILCIVRHCHAEGDGHSVGMEFVKFVTAEAISA